ncbi:MAG: MgtC/SapB family protein [Deltaproteobacteria bacterium]|nr:MgtC/SapB family protein [Deltaproteobacteria bacterium]MCX7952099.1 MgtC/SapB family protein [Deltaproteobacteria bacterium]
MVENIIDFAKDSYFGRILIAGLLGALIGLEREFARRDPSLKTFTVLCIASAIYGILGEHFSSLDRSDPTRIAGHVAAGVGFLGAGAIFKYESKILGLTSAALVWFAAAVGVCVGLGLIRLAVEVTLITILLLYVLRLLHKALDMLVQTPE